MYLYDEFDREFVAERAGQFRGQVTRRLNGRLTEEQFKPLRLQNGLYLELHAYMIRIAIPYGVLSSRQLRQLAFIARKWDRGTGHFTTRQNIQFNWIKLEEAPDIIDALAEVGMHAIQSSGACIRNVTADPYAGVAVDEIEDPRIWAEALRQWSSLHPEFAFLPRKTKIAITGAAEDRAAIRFHDIGLKIIKNRTGDIGFQVFAGGGQGRTPIIAQEIASFLPKEHLLSYIEAIVRVHNLHGRRDGIERARLKFLVKALGIEEFRRLVEEEWSRLDRAAIDLPDAEFQRIAAHFAPQSLKQRRDVSPVVVGRRRIDPNFDRWVKTNVLPHRVPGYAIVNVSLKAPGKAPGDATAEQMEAVADIAEQYSHGEIRVAYQQNLVLPTVAISHLAKVYDRLTAAQLETANRELITDIICCPGLDYCGVANARSIPVAREIAERFAAPAKAEAIGPLRLNLSGCINACAHHHAGNIGVLGVDKKGTEFYQITLGGSPKDDAQIGEIVGPAFAASEVADAVETIVETYLKLRKAPSETFLAAYRRLGKAPFHAAIYGEDGRRSHVREKEEAANA